jgi:carbamoylphosphate synthase small subunit
MSGYLLLEDGAVFEGESVGAEGFAFGEAVFTTAMSGYQEVATDPSFEGQIVCFTAPMVGNYGVEEARSESRRAHARAVVDGLVARPWARGAHPCRHALARPASARAGSDAGGGGRE